MRRELRECNIEEIKALNNSEIVLGIGTEGCINKFNHITKKIINFKNECGFPLQNPVKIILPKITEYYNQNTFRLVKEAADTYDIEEIVINDFGSLFKINKEFPDRFKIIIGRTLIRCLEYVPWIDHLISPVEDPALIENIRMPTILHKAKIELFKKWNVYGVELNPTTAVFKYFDQIKSTGFKIYMHKNSFIAAIGRTCPVVRYNKKKPIGCHNLCDTLINAEINKIWGVEQTTFFETPIPKTVQQFPVYQCYGNIVFYQNNMNNFPFEKCDGIIINCKLSDPDNMS